MRGKKRGRFPSHQCHSANFSGGGSDKYQPRLQTNNWSATGGGDSDSFQKTPKSRGEGSYKRQPRPNMPKRSVVGEGDGGSYPKPQFPSCAASKSRSYDPSVLKRSPRHIPTIVESRELWGFSPLMMTQSREDQPRHQLRKS